MVPSSSPSPAPIQATGPLASPHRLRGDRQIPLTCNTPLPLPPLSPLFPQAPRQSATGGDLETTTISHHFPLKHPRESPEPPHPQHPSPSPFTSRVFASIRGRPAPHPVSLQQTRTQQANPAVHHRPHKHPTEARTFVYSCRFVDGRPATPPLQEKPTAPNKKRHLFFEMPSEHQKRRLKKRRHTHHSRRRISFPNTGGITVSS